MTVPEWALEWLHTHKEPTVNKKYYSDIKSRVTRIITPYIGQLKLRQVQPFHLQRILNGLTAYSPSYINKIHDIICQIFKTVTPAAPIYSLKFVLQKVLHFLLN